MAKFNGVETGKAQINWGIGVTPPALVKAYGQVKKAAILAINEVSTVFSLDVFNTLMEILDEIISGQHNNLFSIPLKQGGAGTSLNMNMNEVISFLANDRLQTETLNYLEDINRFQSTNDTFNTAVTIIYLEHLNEIEKKVIELQEILVEFESRFSNTLITGRTEMMSALPITLGQVFASYSGSIERDRWRFNKVKERVRDSVLGGTAIGTCFSAPSKYIFSCERHLRAVTGLPLSRSQNLTSDISMCDKFVEASSVYDILVNTLFKISSDFTYYVSRGEFIHPELQYGSTIMPMKVNPVLLEFVKGLSINISLEVRKINEYSRNGQLQLNAFLPFILESEIEIFDSIVKAIDSITLFISSFKINQGIIDRNLLDSGVIINSLRPYCSYEKLKELSVLFSKEDINSLEEMILFISKNTDLSEDFLREYIQPGGFTSFYKEIT